MELKSLPIHFSGKEPRAFVLKVILQFSKLYISDTDMHIVHTHLPTDTHICLVDNGLPFSVKKKKKKSSFTFLYKFIIEILDSSIVVLSILL